MIEEIWVINAAGIPLFHVDIRLSGLDESVEDLMKSALFAGVWTAINSVAQQLNGNSISSLHLGTRTITLKKSDSFNLIFMANAPRDVNDKVVSKVLARLMESFIDKYSRALKEWNGNVEQFRSFKQEVEKVIHESYPERFQRALADI